MDGLRVAAVPVNVGWQSLSVPHGLPFSDAEEFRGSFCNWILWVAGPPQSGKTFVLCAVTRRMIELGAITDDAAHERRRDDRFVFVSAPSAFRKLRKAFGDSQDNLYDAGVLILDDLDKVEESYRPLIRDVLVFRQDRGRLTVLSATDVSALQRIDAQLHARLRDASSAVLPARRKVATTPSRQAEKWVERAIPLLSFSK